MNAKADSDVLEEAAIAPTPKSRMLLIHGFTGTPVMWEPLVPFLSEHHELHAITLPGHHGGVPIPDAGENIVETILDIVERELDKLGWDRAHLVGNSLGGWLALLLANRGRALSTVAISPAGGWRLNSAETRRAVRLFRVMQAGLKYFYPLALELAARPRGRKLALMDAVAYPSRLPGPLAKQWIRAAKDTPAFELLMSQSPYVNAPESLPGLDGPVRVLWGGDDRILPFERYAAGWRGALADAEWITLNDLGHVPMSDRPEFVAQMISDFSTAYDARQVPMAAAADAAAKS